MSHKPKYKDFQEFTQHIRAQRELQTVLNTLQTHFDNNLTLTLFCVWVAYAGYGRLRSNELAGLEKSIFLWHQSITYPLQSLYEKLTHDEIKKCVLEVLQQAETVEQQKLMHQFQRSNPKHQSVEKKIINACKNWLSYCKHRQHQPANVTKAICQLLYAVFPEASYETIQSYCHQYLIDAYPYGHQYAIWLA